VRKSRGIAGHQRGDRGTAPAPVTYDVLRVGESGTSSAPLRSKPAEGVEELTSFT